MIEEGEFKDGKLIFGKEIFKDGEIHEGEYND